jgi:hypothetical protein
MYWASKMIRSLLRVLALLLLAGCLTELLVVFKEISMDNVGGLKFK